MARHLEMMRRSHEWLERRSPNEDDTLESVAATYFEVEAGIGYRSRVAVGGEERGELLRPEKGALFEPVGGCEQGESDSSMVGTSWVGRCHRRFDRDIGRAVDAEHAAGMRLREDLPRGCRCDTARSRLSLFFSSRVRVVTIVGVGANVA